jgi:signal transduction histidine kinase
MILLAALTIAVSTVVGVALRWIQRDRSTLLQRFSSEKLAQIEEAAAEIAEDFADITEDLRFAGELIRAADSAADRRRELGALLAVVKQYRMIHVYDPQGELTLAVTDPLARPDLVTPEFTQAMRETASRTWSRPPTQTEISTAITADHGGWFRVFATAITPGGGAIAVLVDTQPFFDKLRLINVRDTSRLLLLGAHGRPAPASDPLLVDLLPRLNNQTSMATIVHQMRTGRRGSVQLTGSEADLLGLGRDDVVAVFAPVAIRGGRHWSVATFSTTAALRATERAIFLRLGISAGVVVLCFIGFGAHVVLNSRRQLAIQMQLRHAEQLAHLHEKTEKILDNVPTGVMVLSAAGRITSLNRTLRELVPEPATGVELACAFPEAPAAHVERLQALIGEAGRTGRVQSTFGERLALFGSEGQYSLHAVPLEPRYPDAHTLLVIDDVSRVGSLESQLLRAEKLATVGILAAGIAHEIGTPLGIVRARAEFIAGKLGSPHPLSAGTQVIIDQIDLISRTIRQLLDFARIRPAVVQPVSIAAVARSVVELLRFELDKARVSVDTDIPADLTVAADADQFQQVLVNLLLNSCDACAPGGLIAVRAQADRSDVPGCRQARIAVHDDGCGIPAELRHQIFDPFFSTKKRGKGTGLGLSIVAQIVRNHGGQVEVKSPPGRGTDVVLLWPTGAQRPADPS